MLSLAEFYAADRLGNLFGAPGPYYGPAGHLGVDVIHAPRTPIPSWCSGRVVISTFYRLLGETVVIDRDDGEGFAGYCHMTIETRAPVGEYISVGETVGTVGSTGLASSGPHAHVTLEPTFTIGTQNALDPLPHIRKALSSLALAGGGTTPIGVDMPLDAADKDWLNKMGASIVQQIKGEGPWVSTPGTIGNVRRDIDWISQKAPESLKAIHAAVQGIEPSATTTDIAPVLEALRALPKALREELARGLSEG
jgi:hypothetical protein